MTDTTDNDHLILTPTARLARAVLAEHAARALQSGATTWFTPRVLTLDAWQDELREHYALHSHDTRIPISAAQARILWQREVEQQVFIGDPAVADLAESAWRRLHEYDLPLPWEWQGLELTPDTAHFQRWALRFRRVCEQAGWIDSWTFAHELPAIILRGEVPIPAHITLSGFEQPLTPLAERTLAACARRGTPVTGKPSASESAEPSIPVLPLVALATAEAELQCAAGWSRARLVERSDARIAIVVPDLAGRLSEVERILRTTFSPENTLAAPATPPPWHISLGVPLRAWPLVSDALRLLALDANCIPQADLLHLLHSPFIVGAITEQHTRAQTAFELMNSTPWALTAREASAVLERLGSGDLSEIFTRWRIQRGQWPTTARASEWTAIFQATLSTFGFGSGRALDSREFQVLQRWHDLLQEFSGFDVVWQAPVNAQVALDALHGRAARIVFREQNPGAPLEILGVEEAMGARFDAAWLTTLDAETWPADATRDPFIPLPLQRDIPGTDSASAAAAARCKLQALTRIAPALQGSFVRGIDSVPRLATQLCLFANVDEQPIAAAPPAAPLERLADDSVAPPYPEDHAEGGTRVLELQALCPFRAFAEIRLSAGAAEPARPGIDSRLRGKLLHVTLERLWHELDSQRGLCALSDDALTDRVIAVIGDVLAREQARFTWRLTPQAAVIEEERMTRLIVTLLALERERSDFTVAGRELNVTMQFGGLTLKGVVDRVDRLVDGRRLIIDYKSGQPKKPAWEPTERMADPQLPAYAVTLAADGIAFATLHVSDVGFSGRASEDLGVVGVTPASTSAAEGDESWISLTSAWRHHLDELGRRFRAGAAAVDPIKSDTCRYCHLGALCRVQERRRRATS
ncbi:MAG: PD-(D/E)XK nuclease family protein [Pseudomonadales bacterium]